MRLWFALGLGLLLYPTLAACVAGAPGRDLAPLVPPAAATPTLRLTPAPTATVQPDSGWQLLRPGLERRIINLFGSQGRQIETLYILRFDSALYRFDVAYRPGEPQLLSQWQADTGALLVVNAGYFTENYIHTGRIIAGGQGSGASYGDFAGMFVVTDAGPELRWLRQRPYDPAEPLRAAVQSFPLLIRPGGTIGFPDEDGRLSRRTVVAQDRDGRLLFLLAPWGGLTLHQLSAYLAASDLDLEIALNLDGGASSGLLLAEPAEGMPAFVPLPAVITVYAP
jgi:uncharacterized protein YigE (DUF2233 family)